MIIIITIFIIVILTIKKYENFKLSLKPSKKCNNKKQYRISDMFKDNQFRDHITGYEYHKKNYPNSIIVEYMDRTPYAKQYHILLDIMINRLRDKSYKKVNKLIKIYNKKYIIMHLRTGDIIDNNYCNAHDIFYNTNNCLKMKNYDKPISYFIKSKLFYDELIEYLKKNYPNKKILIISGFHFNINDNKKSLEYLQIIKKYFYNNNIKIKFRINRDADEDFLIMCNSKYFIKVSGGFSNLIGELVVKNGGKCINL